MKKRPSRIFVDLLWEKSSKWANWNPSLQIKVGDYGTINSSTGNFEVDGNIYEYVTSNIAAKHPPLEDTTQPEIIVESSAYKAHGFPIDSEIDAPELAQAPIKGRWESTSSRGALLIIATPRRTLLPQALINLPRTEALDLKNKLLVTELISCPAYCSYLSMAKHEFVDISLVGNSWWTQGASGLFRAACDPGGSYSYTPLYGVSEIGGLDASTRNPPASGVGRGYISDSKPQTTLSSLRPRRDRARTMPTIRLDAPSLRGEHIHPTRPSTSGSGAQGRPFRELRVVTEESSTLDIRNFAMSSSPNAQNSQQSTTIQHDSHEHESPDEDAVDSWVSRNTSKFVIISGRAEDEEKHWWDPEKRQRCHRPGPGFLPSAVARMLHHPDHPLLAVNVMLPSLPNSTPSSRTQSPANRSNLLPSTPSPITAKSQTTIFHPNAYYCPKEQGWVLLSCTSFLNSPPPAQSFRHHPLPDQHRRTRTKSCVGDDGTSSRKVNNTHHFHVYYRAVDARDLDPPFHRNEWQKSASQTQPTSPGYGGPSTADEDLLDLYVCCQCSSYCVASGVLPGVIPQKCFNEFIQDRHRDRSLDQSPEDSVRSAVHTIIELISAILWRGDKRIIQPSGGFQAMVGWNPTVQQLFEALGFQVLTFIDFTRSERTELCPPTMDPSTREGEQNRGKLLCAWVELVAWLQWYQREHGGLTLEKVYTPSSDAKAERFIGETYTTWVTTEDAWETLQNMIGAHPNQIPRGRLPDSVLGALSQPLEDLGLAHGAYSWEFLVFAYWAQCRCDPANTVKYFSSFCYVTEVMKTIGFTSQELHSIIAHERDRLRYTTVERKNAIRMLGFGEGGHLRMEFTPTTHEQDISGAWVKLYEQKRRQGTMSDMALRKNIDEAFRIAAETRGSASLWMLWEKGEMPDMGGGGHVLASKLSLATTSTHVGTIINARATPSIASSIKSEPGSPTSLMSPLDPEDAIPSPSVGPAIIPVEVEEHLQLWLSSKNL